MKILFLPNFRVTRLPSDDPSILTSNKIVGSDAYWFFRHMPEVDVEVLDNATPFPLNLLRDLLKVEIFQPFKALVRQNDYDAVISHSFNAGFVFAILRSFLSRRTPPHFDIDVGSLNGGKENNLQIASIRFALKSVAGILCHSSVNEEFYSKHFTTANREFVSFGVDPTLFKPLAGKASNNFALSVGSTRRDYATLMNAWRQIDFPLKIVGSKMSSLENAPNIQLLGVVPIDKLVELVHNSKFVILPFEDVKYSVGQMTLLQCMAMNKTVIVTSAAGVNDYLLDGDNCLTVRVGNESDIVEKVNLVLRDKDLTERIASRARETVSSRFNEESMAAEILDFIKRTSSTETSSTRD